MSYFSNFVQIIIGFFILLTFGFCSSQNHQSNSHSKTYGAAPASEWKDELFFIEGQFCQHLRHLHQDKEGNLWFGTNVYDIMKYDGASLLTISEKDGIGKGRITGIIEEDNGTIWFGSSAGLIKYDGEDFQLFEHQGEINKMEVYSLLIDSRGTFWIGTLDGVLIFDGAKFLPFAFEKAEVRDTTSLLSYDHITSIFEDSKGHVWFGTDGFGVSVYDGSSFKHFTRANGLCDHNISGIYEDNSGNIWISTMFGGVCIYDGASFRSLNQERLIQGVEATEVYEDSKGHLWFAIENNGVYRYDGKTFTNYGQNEGLETNSILCLLEDQEGRFWLGGWGCLFRLDDGEIFSVTNEGPWE